MGFPQIGGPKKDPKLPWSLLSGPRKRVHHDPYLGLMPKTRGIPQNHGLQDPCVYGVLSSPGNPWPVCGHCRVSTPGVGSEVCRMSIWDLMLCRLATGQFFHLPGPSKYPREWPSSHNRGSKGHDFGHFATHTYIYIYTYTRTMLTTDSCSE